MKKVLFVCTGNTCRSPMAAAIFNRRAAMEAQNFGYEAVSAGLSAFDGDPASPNALLAIKDFPGGDLSRHSARKAKCSDIDEAFLVLTMSRSHKQHILAECPGAYQKIFTLKEYAYGVPDDIKDPYGGSLEEYRQCAREIAEAVEKLIGKIKKN